MFDPEAFGAAMGDLIRAAVEPLEKRITDLQGQLKEAPNFVELVAAEVEKRLAEVPAPRNGKDVDMDVVGQMINKAVEALPPPRAGDPGKSVTLNDVRPLLDEAIVLMRKDADAAIQKRLGELKQPQDGNSVTLDDVKPLIQSEVQKSVAGLPAPKDGLGLAGAMIDREGALQITLTNGEVKSLGRVVGKDGDDGKDGVSFEAFELEYLPESHEMAVKATVAGRTKELRYPAGGIRPAGYWREGMKAKAAEAWVHDGSLWIAIKETTTKPESKGADWIVAARKGRDGETTVKTINAGPPAPIKLTA